MITELEGMPSRWKALRAGGGTRCLGWQPRRGRNRGSLDAPASAGRKDCLRRLLRPGEATERHRGVRPRSSANDPVGCDRYRLMRDGHPVQRDPVTGRRGGAASHPYVGLPP